MARNVHHAAWDGDLQRFRAIVEQDAALVHATDVSRRTPLLWAACEGHVEVARYLLDHGAAINHRDDNRRTALHWACFLGHPGVVLLLLQRGASTTAQDVGGRIPLIYAATGAIHRMLLEHGGSDVDAVDHGGRTACHWACVRGETGVLGQLVEAGADTTPRDADGRTSLDHATGDDHQRCVNVLQEWHRVYTLYRARSVREASIVVANSSAPVDAAPSYLIDRAQSGLSMPMVHNSTHQQHGQPSDDVGEEVHVEVDPVAVEGVVTVYAIEELNGEVFVELMELMDITGAV